MTLLLKVVFFADGDNPIGGEMVCLLVITNNDRTFLLLFYGYAD